MALIREKAAGHTIMLMGAMGITMACSGGLTSTSCRHVSSVGVCRSQIVRPLFSSPDGLPMHSHITITIHYHNTSLGYRALLGYTGSA